MRESHFRDSSDGSRRRDASTSRLRHWNVRDDRVEYSAFVMQSRKSQRKSKSEVLSLASTRFLFTLKLNLIRDLLLSRSRNPQLTKSQCDEGHPACRNCQKSKRECLGYDPIFKQQPGPAPIQPAPSSVPLQGSLQNTSSLYTQNMLPSGYGPPVTNMGYDPALTSGVSSPGSANPQFDYASAIDPALADAAPAHSNQYAPVVRPNFQEDLKREIQSTSPFSSGTGTSDPLHRGGPLLFESSIVTCLRCTV